MDATGAQLVDARPRVWPIAAALIVPLLLLSTLPPLTQPPDYHQFADVRPALGLPSFANVASNFAFLLVGLAGLRLCLRRSVAGARLSWLVFFAGVTLVAFGSTWYHLQPEDATLVWDRLPMTVAFMALFTGVICEHFNGERERLLLAATVAAGIAAVVWWRVTGDLKPYAWIQAAPFIAIAILLVVYRGRYAARYWLACGFGFYAFAKAAEFADAAIYTTTAHAISGHTLKHLLAAVAPFCVYMMLRRRARSF